MEDLARVDELIFITRRYALVKKQGGREAMSFSGIF